MKNLEVGAVVIGRNEGERLRKCFESISNITDVVYVDSGSTDGSRELAESRNIAVVDLEMPPNFTAARARNAGVKRLLEKAPNLQFIQTIDGDCELINGWTELAVRSLVQNPNCGAVCGRLYERQPNHSIYNALCDHEWNTPVGEAAVFGGIAMLRAESFTTVKGYREDMISGEDTEMAMRLRKAGWTIMRLAADMAYHDADITQFTQWWRRAKRGGHGFAEMASLHPDARWPNWPQTCRRIFLWGFAIPLVCVVSLALGLLINRWWLTVTFVLAAAFPIQAIRICFREWRKGASFRLACIIGALFTIGKFPEFIGLAKFYHNRVLGRRAQIIEYKGIRR